MAPGDIYLAHFPFGGSAGRKLRPVLLLTAPVGTVPEVVVAYVSSVIPAQMLPSDILLDPSLPEHASTGLRSVSILRLHRLATLHKQSLTRQLGTVSSATATEVATRLRGLLSL